MAKSAALAFAFLIATGADMKLALGAGFAGATNQAAPAQESKESKADNKQAPDKQASDKQAQAAKKYLEAKRLEEAGNYSDAVAAYKEAIALDPESVDLRVTLGSLYLKNRNTIDAEAQAREATKIAPSNMDVRKLLARIYIAQTFVGTSLNKDKARAAIKELEEIVKIDPKAKIEVPNEREPVAALTLVGGLYLTIDEQDKALEAMKQISDNDASSDEAHYQLADLYFKKNKFREAAVAARKAYDINQKTPNPRKTIVYSGLLAKSLLRIGRTQEALDIYKKAIGIKDSKDATAKSDDDDIMKGGMPTSPLIFDYAEALVYAGRYDDAIKLLDPVIKTIRKDTPYYLDSHKRRRAQARRQTRRSRQIA
jgi:tetratricopeptide (TPR) repeat protein